MDELTEAIYFKLHDLCMEVIYKMSTSPWFVLLQSVILPSIDTNKMIQIYFHISIC
jgi:hypothetical protein